MELGDQKDAFILTNGNPVTIIRQSGNVLTVARIMQMKREKGTGFLSINYLREALFTGSSGIQRGDLIQDQTTGEKYYVVGFQARTVKGIITSIKTNLLMVDYTNNISVTVSRIVQSTTPTYDAFQPSNTTTSTFSANVVIEGRSTELIAELAGGKRKETLKMIAGTGILMLGDEISYLGHIYKVEQFDSDNLSNAVDFIRASREVD